LPHPQAPQTHNSEVSTVDLSPSTLIVVFVIVVAMLAWAYFDVPDTGTL